MKRKYRKLRFTARRKIIPGIFRHLSGRWPTQKISLKRGWIGLVYFAPGAKTSSGDPEKP